MLDLLQNDVSPFVGDYVARLENFVDYYNIEFPFHEGDDTVVLSLRDDVVGVNSSCVVESPNLLFLSHALDQSVPYTDGALGWVQASCDSEATSCVDALPGSILGYTADPANITFEPIPPMVVGPSGSTWLRDALPEEVSDPAGSGSENPCVSQAVRLGAGTYVLSWWDQERALTPIGAFPQELDPIVPYVVEVRNAAAGTLQAFRGAPYRSDWAPQYACSKWSDRHELGFELAEPADVIVSFRPSDGTGPRGSVVIANVQLELVASSAQGAGPYYGTDVSRMMPGPCQSLDPATFRAAFSPEQCDNNGECYYELVDPPFAIDTSSLATSTSYLGGKFARGNYNYRHMTVGVNVAGTGVLDCTATPTSSCYGSGTVRYTLEHDAFESKVIAGMANGEPEVQTFNFGSGAIRNGQALAAERFITMPVSQSDQAMLAQAGVEKTELLGRPLDGAYRFRIWVTPGLQWERVEDIQLVLKYRYWSAVQPSE